MFTLNTGLLEGPELLRHAIGFAEAEANLEQIPIIYHEHLQW